MMAEMTQLEPELAARAHGPPPEEGECYPNSSRGRRISRSWV
jgi:hypothetical protein